jgi:hypothetical protein
VTVKSFTPIYTTLDNVKVRLANKVQFQKNPDFTCDGELPNEFLEQLIVDAETMVEQDLRSRYSIPFQSITYKTFIGLPDHTKRAIRTAVDYKAVIHVLETDFGRGTHVSADNYLSSQKKAYIAYISKLLGRDAIGANDKIDRFKYSPPLEDLMLAYSNSKADDGIRGTIINTDASRNDVVDYAIEQIDNPSRSYIRSPGWGGL